MPESQTTWDIELRRQIEKQWLAGQTFNLEQIYGMEAHFAALYPENRHRRDKLRQALQHLRDQGFIEFLDDDGNYRRVGTEKASGGTESGVVELSTEDVDTLLTSLEYSKQRITDAPDTPYAVRQENLSRIDRALATLRAFKRERSKAG